MTRMSLIHATAALSLFFAPHAFAAEKEQAIPLQPLPSYEETREDSFFSPKSADEIQNLAVIDEELEESLVWEKQGS